MRVCAVRFDTMNVYSSVAAERFTPRPQIICPYFPRAFFASVHTSLAVIFIYCRCKPAVAELIVLVLQTTLQKSQKLFSPVLL
jgi:hypothetical protein